MNSMANALLFLPNANQVSLGIAQTVVPQLLILVHLELIIMVSNVFHICPAKTEEFGTILLVNVFVQQDHSQMELYVLNVLLDNFMQMEDAIVLTVHSLMEFNVQQKAQINVLEFQTLTGTEHIVSASQDSQQTGTHVFAMVL